MSGGQERLEDMVVHVGDVPEHVTVQTFGLGGLCAGFAVTCGPCHSTTSAYLTVIRKDPEIVAREVERHRGCGTTEKPGG